MQFGCLLEHLKGSSFVLILHHARDELEICWLACQRSCGIRSMVLIQKQRNKQEAGIQTSSNPRHFPEGEWSYLQNPHADEPTSSFSGMNGDVEVSKI